KPAFVFPRGRSDEHALGGEFRRLGLHLVAVEWHWERAEKYRCSSPSPRSVCDWTLSTCSTLARIRTIVASPAYERSLLPTWRAFWATPGFSLRRFLF